MLAEPIAVLRPERAPQDAAPTPLRALIVEDSDCDYELLVMLLERAGFGLVADRVEDEAGMRAALARADWDVVISDHRLPAFSARSALSVVQSTGRDVPFIIVSGAMGEDAAVEAMLAGADDYILKDRLARLVPAIERSIKAAAERRVRRAAESALRESEARLRAIAGNLPGMVFEMAREEDQVSPRFIYVSEGSRALFDVEPEELVGDAGVLFRLVSPEDRGSLRAAIGVGRDATTIQWEGRAYARAPGPDGERPMRWLQLSASRRRGPASELWDGLVTDVSALKDAEAKLYDSREELRALTAHLEKAKETERARVAREIHDDIGSTLTGLKVDVAWLRKRFAADPAVMEKVGSMAALLDSAVQASVRIARDLRPPILDFGFVAAVEWQARDFQKRTGVVCSFSCNDEGLELPAEAATAVFRIFQELLTNVTKHAQASRVDVSLVHESDVVRLQVTDDGVGIAEADKRKGGSYGIRGMTERAREMSGSLLIEGHPDGGTRATLAVPLGPAGSRP